VKKTLSIVLLSMGVSGCAEKAPFHREYRGLIARASTPEERRHSELQYELLCVAEKNQLSVHFKPQDGVSEFEAWMLAKVYSGEEIGACLDIGLPERRGHNWEVSTFVGRPGKEGPPVVIDSSSGKITCDGHPAVEQPLEYLIKFEARFKKKT
jgi:hypothetical protein